MYVESSAAATGLLATSFYLGQIPVYTANDINPILLLLALFIVMKGIENSGFLNLLGTKLGNGRYLPVKLVAITFLLSAIVNIDVSLVAIIPLIFSLNIRQREHLVILVALTAHAGAALTPFGTPQNLFIFSFYAVPLIDFIKTIAPFSFGMFAVFLLFAVFMKTSESDKPSASNAPLQPRVVIIYAMLLLWVILCVLRVFPPVASLLVIGYPLLFNRAALRVDYALLATFLCFIGLAMNSAQIIATSLQHPHHVFLFSSLLSQFISNVPTTLLLTRFTDQWEALLWGVNVGGFGSLVAAMAMACSRPSLARRARCQPAAITSTLSRITAGPISPMERFMLCQEEAKAQMTMSRKTMIDSGRTTLPMARTAPGAR